MTKTGLMSADNHFVEPPDLFTSRVSARLRDEAPKTVWGPLPDGRGGEFYTWPGAAPGEFMPVASLALAGMDSAVMMERNRDGFAGMPAFAASPEARVAEQDRDGVQAEVLYPSWGMFLFSMPETELRTQCFRAFNDWSADFCGYSPKRLLGCGVVDLGGPSTVGASIREVERIGAHGLRPILLPTTPAEGHRFSEKEYEPFWDAVEGSGVPISFHILCNRRTYPFTSQSLGNTGPLQYYTSTIVHEIQATVTDLAAGGVFERHPSLRLVVAEADCSWLPHYLYRLDHVYYSGMYRYLPLEARPSDYVKRNCFTTFQWEPAQNVQAAIDVVGADHLCWGSDFPHNDSTYPKSVEVTENNLAAISSHERELLLGGSMAELYRL